MKTQASKADPLVVQLAQGRVLALRAQVVHSRRGGIRHAFRMTTDFLLFAPDHARFPALSARNRFNLLSVFDRDHGGTRGAGQGARWAEDCFARHGILPAPGRVLALLTQPRFLGLGFNPVSFWLLIEGDAPVAAIAEVNNTFGQRHCYLLAHPDLTPLTPQAQICAQKIFHVSPFQDVAGGYDFAFSTGPSRIAIRIRHRNGREGVDTAMAGPLRPLTPLHALGLALRRPGGAMRVLARIYWHALCLKLKGARYRPLPAPPQKDLSR